MIYPSILGKHDLTNIYRGVANLHAEIRNLIRRFGEVYTKIISEQNFIEKIRSFHKNQLVNRTFDSSHSFSFNQKIKIISEYFLKETEGFVAEPCRPTLLYFQLSKSFTPKPIYSSLSIHKIKSSNEKVLKKHRRVIFQFDPTCPDFG